MNRKNSRPRNEEGRGTASSSSVSVKNTLTVSQLRTLRGGDPLAEATTMEAASDPVATVMGQVAANTADSEGGDADATHAEITPTIDPVCIEASATELITAPVSTIVASGSGNIDTMTSTERNPAQSSAIAVGSDNDVPAVSASNTASSSRHKSRRNVGGLIRHAPTPANTIATSDRAIIDTTMSTERHTAQNSAIAVVGDNAVSVSNSASSTAY